jgi:hypothetical protein
MLSWLALRYSGGTPAVSGGPGRSTFGRDWCFGLFGRHDNLPPNFSDVLFWHLRQLATLRLVGWRKVRNCGRYPDRLSGATSAIAEVKRIVSAAQLPQL